MENNEIMAQQQTKGLAIVEQTTAIATNSVWENKDQFNLYCCITKTKKKC